MRHLVSIILMAILAWIAAIFVTPADPVSMLIVVAAILAVAIPSYLLGLRSGAARDRKRSSTGRAETNAVWMLLASAILCGGADVIPVYALDRESPAGQKESDRPHPDRKDAEKSKPPFTISKETTHITRPLTKEGYVDYVAALNERMSEGVTIENNAAVPFFQAVGPRAVDEGFRAEFFERLGIAVPPEEGDYFVSSEEYLKRRGIALDDDSKFRIYDATEKLWTKDDNPLIFDWLKANEPALSRIVKALDRPRWFVPTLLDQEDEAEPPYLGPLSLPLQACRDVARALTARAMLRVNEGRIPEAWQDLMAVHGLARHVGHEPMLISRLVAIAMDWIAAEADIALAQSGRLTAEQARKMIADFNSLPPMPTMAEAIDIGERYFYLNTAQWLIRHQDDVRTWKANGFPDSAIKLLGRVPGGEIDWDTPLRMGNEHYDGLVAAASKPEPLDRLQANGKLAEEYQDMLEEKRDELRGFGGFVKLLFSGKETGKLVGESIGHVLLATLTPAVDQAVEVELRRTAHLDLVRIAFALAACRSDRGRYPDKLAALSPKYVTRLPQDPFTGDDFRYVPKAGGYLLYSVGQNGKDEAQTETPPIDDIVVRTQKRLGL